MDDGSLMCWGSNDDGKLGMLKLPNTYATSPVGPVNLGSGRTAKAVSLGSESHTCAILDDDTLKCWGDGGYGRLGYGDYTQREDPEATAVVNLGSGHTAKAVSAGRQHTCAILDDDTLKCWGNGGLGRLGYGDNTQREAPEATAVVNLGSGHTAKAVSAGRQHTCAILDDDTLKCWGNGGLGRLGYGDNTQREAPEATAVVNLGSGRTAKAVSAGYAHTCAILDDDTLKCWGSNYNGRVGVGSSDELIWDPTEVKFDGSSSSAGSAGAPGPAGPKRDERTFMVATLIVAVIWPVVLYFVRHVHPGTLTARLRQLVGAKPRLLDQPIDVESRR